MENLVDPQTDNSQAQESEASVATGEQSGDTGSGSSFSWKSTLNTDLRNSAIAQKFSDDVNGFQNMVKSHNELEKVFSSYEKVPIPKGPEDKDGWNRFAKAMGIPDRAEGYGLETPALPDALKGSVMTKDEFAQVMHAHKITPDAAKSLWKIYNEKGISSYNKVLEQHQQNLTQMINSLKGEWGDAYESKVELGQMVINKFAADQDMNDYITAVLSQDPRGIKFLAKLGEQFAENRIGEFDMANFSNTPEEYQNELDKMTMDMNGPYMNQAGKFTEREHQAAMDRANFLRASIIKARG